MISPPRELRASLPAELRGMRRDGARLCVVERQSGRISHTTVAHLGEYLASGDLLVVNSSRTLPAALRVDRDGAEQVQLRPGALRDGEWDALAVQVAPPHHNVALVPGETLRAPGGLRFRVVAPRSDAPLLWRMTVESGDPVRTLLDVRRADPLLVRAEPGAAGALPDRLRRCSRLGGDPFSRPPSDVGAA